MGDLYYLDVGFVEDTVLYELVPKEVGRLKQATVQDIATYLDNKGVMTIVMDSADPLSIQGLRQRLKRNKILKTIRLGRPHPLKHPSKTNDGGSNGGL